jgi:hypothetical protein
VSCQFCVYAVARTTSPSQPPAIIFAGSPAMAGECRRPFSTLSNERLKMGKGKHPAIRVRKFRVLEVVSPNTSTNRCPKARADVSRPSTGLAARSEANQKLPLIGGEKSTAINRVRDGIVRLCRNRSAKSAVCPVCWSGHHDPARDFLVGGRSMSASIVDLHPPQNHVCEPTTQ